MSPNGTGTVTVPSGYKDQEVVFGDDSLVNKSYVDAVANGLDVKASVRVATTANLSGTYNNGAGTITVGSNGALSQLMVFHLMSVIEFLLKTRQHKHRTVSIR